MGDVNGSSHQSQAGRVKGFRLAVFLPCGEASNFYLVLKITSWQKQQNGKFPVLFSTLGDTVWQGRGRQGERERRGRGCEWEQVGQNDRPALRWFTAKDRRRGRHLLFLKCSRRRLLKKPTERGRPFLEMNRKHGDTRKQPFQHRMAQNKNTAYHGEIGREEKMNCPGPDKGCALSHLIKGFRPCLNDEILEVTLRTPPWVSCCLS